MSILQREAVRRRARAAARERIGIGERAARLGNSLGRGLLTLAVSAGALTMVLPFLWMVSTSLKSESEAFAWPPQLFPHTVHWHNYAEAWRMAPFARFFFNSSVVSLTVTGASLLLSTLAGYAFAKYRFRGRDALFLAVLATMMVPFQVCMIPTFLILKHLHWLDTYWGLTVPGFASAFGIFFMRQFMLTIPDDFLDAARIDGCSELRIWARIMLPLCKPALATLAVFTFMGSWNDFIGPLIVVKSDEMRTLPLAISALSSGHYVMSWPLLMAGATFVILPVLIAFLLAQRYFTESIVMSGIKG
jgi:multiple sugar transport system permease protein